MRFRLDVTTTPQYEPFLDEPFAISRSSGSPHRIVNACDELIDTLLDDGYTIVERTPRGRECRKVTVYDYEVCTTPAIIITITATNPRS